jgi:hypothetical protein
MAVGMPRSDVDTEELRVSVTTSDDDIVAEPVREEVNVTVCVDVNSWVSVGGSVSESVSTCESDADAVWIDGETEAVAVVVRDAVATRVSVALCFVECDEEILIVTVDDEVARRVAVADGENVNVVVADGVAASVVVSDSTSEFVVVGEGVSENVSEWRSVAVAEGVALIVARRELVTVGRSDSVGVAE